MTDLPAAGMELIFREIAIERNAQDAKWGEQNHLDRHPRNTKLDEYKASADYWKKVNNNRVMYLNQRGVPSDRNCYWDGILLEEVFEALAEEDSRDVRNELIQAAAVIVAWIEAIDRRLRDA